MMDWLSDFYPWVRALHVVSIIAWMAGLLYLPRLFVYHADASVGSEMSETFKVMERRLLRAIMNPAMVLAYLFGGMLLATPGVVDWGAGYIYVKLALVAGVTVHHHLLALWRKNFVADRNIRPARYYRVANEVVTALMIAIVVMIIVRPF